MGALGFTEEGEQEENATDFLFPNDSQGNLTMALFQSPLHVPHLRILFIISYVVVFCLCVVGNLMVLVVMARHARLRTRTNFFLGNLAAADLSVGLLCVLPNLSTFLFPTWVLGTAMCKVYHFVENMSYTTSVLLLTMVALERYIAIMHPLRARQWFTTTRLKITQTCIWMVGLVWNVPYFMAFRTMFVSDSSGAATFCFLDKQFSMRLYDTLNFVLWYLLPLVVLTSVYCSISLTLWRTTRPHQLAVANPIRASINASTASYKCHTQIVHMHRCGVGDEAEDSLSRGNSSSTSSRSPPSDVAMAACSTGSPQPSPCPASGSNFSVPDPCAADVPLRPKGKSNATFASSARSTRCGIATEENGNSSVPYQRCGNSRRNGNSLSNCLHFRDKFSRSTSSANDASSTHRRQACHYRLNSQSLLKSRRRVIRLLIAVIVAFAVCVLPHRVRLLMHYWNLAPSRDVGSGLFAPLAFLLLYLNSALNPILYSLFSQSFRRSFLDCCVCRCRRVSRSRSAVAFNVRMEVGSRPLKRSH